MIRKTVTIFFLLTICSLKVISQKNLPFDEQKYFKIAENLVRTSLEDRYGYNLLNELCKIGPRLSGSENSLKAIYWIKDQMEKSGFDRVFLQPTMVPKWERGKIEKCEIVKSKFFKGKKLNIGALGGSIATPANGISAKVIEVKNFIELKEKREQVKGKIVFFNRKMDQGTINTFGAYGGAVDQRANGAIEAGKYGAAAVVVRSVTTKHDIVPHVGAMYYIDSIPKIPSMSVSYSDADFLEKALLQDPELQLKVTTSCKSFNDVQSYNVIADLIGSEKPDELIVIGGHFDSWDKGVGAHDDAAGCMQSFEVLSLFKRLNIKPKRTIRCIFYINEENGLRGGIEYGKYSDTSKVQHLAAIELDRGSDSPRGFYMDADDRTIEKVQSWLPLLNKSEIDWIRKGGTGGDISTIKKRKALFGYAPDIQRYFDFHHSANDVFSEIHPRSFELGSAANAILVYLLSEEGL